MSSRDENLCPRSTWLHLPSAPTIYDGAPPRLSNHVIETQASFMNVLTNKLGIPLKIVLNPKAFTNKQKLLVV